MKRIFVLCVLVCVVASFAQESKLRFAVCVPGEDIAGARGSNNTLGAEFVMIINGHDIYSASDQTEAIFRQVTREDLYRRSGVGGNEQIKKLGELLDVHYLCVAEISGVKGGFYYLEARLIDAATSELVRVVSMNSGLKDIGEIARASQQLARKLFVAGETLPRTAIPSEFERAAAGPRDGNAEAPESAKTEAEPHDDDGKMLESAIAEAGLRDDSVRTQEPAPAQAAVETRGGAAETLEPAKTAATSHDNDLRAPESEKAAAKKQRPALSEALAIGLSVSYNLREGYRKFDGVDKYQHVYNTNPTMVGAALGRRFALKEPWLGIDRVQTALEVGWGSARDGEFRIDLSTQKDAPVVLYSNYLTYGVTAEAHTLFPSDMRTYFLSAGLGLHMAGYNSSLKTMDGQQIGGWDLSKIWTASPSVSIGAGMEYMVSGGKALSLAYNFRFWRSSSYIESGALFPMGADYREFFFSHALQLQLLLPRK